MKQKLVLSLDSQALSAFQRCPEEHRFAYVKHLEPAQSKSFYDTGTLVHLLLALYYKLRRRGFTVERTMMLIIEKRLTRYCEKLNISQSEKMFILGRFAEYVNNYKSEFHMPVGIEVGFSEKIFEDKNFIFIYEGRVDWIGFSFIEKLGKLLHFEDHKTRSQNYSLDEYRNQFFGYAWMMKKVYGEDYKGWGSINYFGLQEDKTNALARSGKLFERIWFNFSDGEILQWQNDTIMWFHRIAQARLFNVFPRSWQCDRKFGVCSFKQICKQPTQMGKNLILAGSNNFTKRPKKWTAWD